MELNFCRLLKIKFLRKKILWLSNNCDVIKYGLKFCRAQFLRFQVYPRKQRKFSSSKLKCYTVVKRCNSLSNLPKTIGFSKIMNPSTLVILLRVLSENNVNWWRTLPESLDLNPIENVWGIIKILSTTSSQTDQPGNIRKRNW